MRIRWPLPSSNPSLSWPLPGTSLSAHCLPHPLLRPRSAVAQSMFLPPRDLLAQNRSPESLGHVTSQATHAHLGMPALLWQGHVVAQRGFVQPQCHQELLRVEVQSGQCGGQPHRALGPHHAPGSHHAPGLQPRLAGGVAGRQARTFTFLWGSRWMRTAVDNMWGPRPWPLRPEAPRSVTPSSDG